MNVNRCDTTGCCINRQICSGLCPVKVKIMVVQSVDKRGMRRGNVRVWKYVQKEKLCKASQGSYRQK